MALDYADVEIAAIEEGIELELSEALDSLDFAEDLPEDATPEQMDKLATPLLRYILRSGDRGYKGSIDSITDNDGNPPSQANNWLFDPDTETYEGQLTDNDGATPKVIGFKIERDGDGWTSTTYAVSGVED